jgi:Arc/MetJ-type ribon-helix-helix transcriptional regulator
MSSTVAPGPSIAANRSIHARLVVHQSHLLHLGVRHQPDHLLVHEDLLFTQKLRVGRLRMGRRKCRRLAVASRMRGGRIQLGGKVANSMIDGMTRQKIAITLPEEQVAAARQAVAEGRAASVSAFISQALARRDADEEMAETIAEIYAESGQPTDEDRLWARRVLGLEP